MSLGRASGGKTPSAERTGSHDETPPRRFYGVNTDDSAIFVEDTVDRITAQCMDASPSAMALLSPQHLPSGQAHHVDVTEYDSNHLGHLAATRLSGSKRRGSGGVGEGKNTSAVQLNFSGGSTSHSPTPKANRASLSRASQNTSLSRSSPRPTVLLRSPSTHVPMVPLAEYEKLEKDRNRLEKMYEHQRTLYEDMADKQADTYQALQEKIMEVVALSTRNEESKRFIRQLKKEMSESRTRVMDMQNKALEETRSDRLDRSRYESLIEEQERKYERMVERHETKMAGMESLLKDLTCMRGERDRIHVAQLDSLLKAAYSKSTALFSDLLRQGRQIDMLYDSKADIEGQLEQARRDKKEAERTLQEERRRMMVETERFVEQIEEQQHQILNLRQMLIRTMDNRDDVFGDASESYNSSFHSSPSDEEEEYEEEKEEEAAAARRDKDTVAAALGAYAAVKEKAAAMLRDRKAPPVTSNAVLVGRKDIFADATARSISKNDVNEQPAPALPARQEKMMAPTTVDVYRTRRPLHAAPEKEETEVKATTQEAPSRRRLDFATALAAVAEKRLKDRSVREEEDAKSKELLANKENERSTATAASSTRAARYAVTKSHKEKEKKPAEEEEEDDGPKLFRRVALQPIEPHRAQ